MKAKIKTKFIKISNKKVPLHSLDTYYDYTEIESDANVAILLDEPYVVLDVDDEKSFDILCEIIKNEKVKTRILKTSRGGHFWFKSLKSLTNKVNASTPITLKTDIKSWGKKSLVTIKKDNVWREWLQEDENVDTIPFWLEPIAINKDFLDMKEHDGRNPALFSYIIPLLTHGFKKEQIYKIFTLINTYIFEVPLDVCEIDAMFEKNDIFEKQQLCFFKGKEFLHNVFADWLKESYFFKSYGKQLYIYDKGRYIRDQDEVFRKMIDQIPSLMGRHMNEAYENLRLKLTSTNEKLNTLVLNVKNGVFDLEKNEFLEHSPYYFTINQLDCIYDPNAYDIHVDNMFNKVLCKDKNLRILVEEMLGYLLIGDCRFQKAFVLLGQGSNGKSVFLEMIMKWLGNDNCSSLALEDLSERFRTAELVGKVANIGDDSGGDLLKNTAIFKKIVTGDSITIERKNKDVFQYNNSAKLLFSANQLPPSSDKSFGFFRRIVIIPFNAIIKETDDDYDPNIIDNLITENAKSYLLNLAIKSAYKILRSNKMTIPEVSLEVTKLYETDNNSVLQWLETKPEILQRSNQDVYTDYCLYCDGTNMQPFQIRKFNNEIRNHNPRYFISHKCVKQINIYFWDETS